MLQKIIFSLRRFSESIRTDGLETTLNKVLYRIKRGKFIVQQKYCESEYGDPDIIYRHWREKHRLTEQEMAVMRDRVKNFPYQPLISIVMPTYNGDPIYLEKAIQSIIEQCYPKWELCISDDGSILSKSKDLLKHYTEIDSRIVWKFNEKNEGIIANSQKAAMLAQGEFLSFMDQDDLLSTDALFRVAEKLNASPDIDLLYSDHDKVDLNDVHREVYFKPDYSLDEFLCHNYIGHLTILRKKIFDQIGGFMPGFEGAQDFELLLRAIERTNKVAHLPYVLYSWRRSPGSTASTPTAKHYAYESGKKALENFFHRKCETVNVEETGERGLYRCRFKVNENVKVSVIIPARNPNHLGKCLEGLRKRTEFKNLEIVVVGHSLDEQAKKMIREAGAKLIAFDETWNLSKMINRGRENAAGDYILLLHNDIEIIHPDWLLSLLEPIQRRGVGIVGAKLLYPDRTIQHGGIILGLNGVLDHALKGVPDDAIIYEQPHYLVRNCSAVSGACLLTSTQVFDQLHGFDERYPEHFSDVDFCLRVREKDLWIVWTPFARLIHHDADPKPSSDEEKLFAGQWKETISMPDPFYNVNLTRKYFDFSPRLD